MSRRRELDDMFKDHRYDWDSSSALIKAMSNTSMTVKVGPVSIRKDIFGPNDSNKNSFRNCSKCGKHINYHRDSWCPV